MAPLLINNESGLAEDLPEEQATGALQAGTHGVPLNDPQGNPTVAPLTKAQEMLGQGYSQPSPEQLQSLADHAKYSSPIEKAKTFAEGLGVGSTLGASTGVERMFGAKDEDIQGRRGTNPGIHAAGEIGSFVLPVLGEANLTAKAGRAAVEAAGLAEAAKNAGTIGRIATKAAHFGLEGAIMQGGDEVSKLLSNDPHQSLETAAADIGYSGLIGMGLGSAVGAVSPLWKAANGSKVGKFIEDFKARINEHLTNPDPANALTEELKSYHGNVTSAADEVYGPIGLKAQEIQKLMPEMNPRIESQISDISSKLDSAVERLAKDPLVGKLQKEVEKFKSAVSGEVDPITLAPTKTLSAGEAFDAAQSLKQQLQEWGKYNKTLVPLGEREFRDASKGLATDLRKALEDPDVWGKAAERQKAINNAFSEFLPAKKDFEKRFTSEVNGERQIDAGKVNTYINQLGKPNAEIKQQMLENFRDAAEKYKKVIHDSHVNLGLESPIEQHALNAVNSSLKELSPGAKLADTVIKKGLAGVAGKGLGAGVGGLAGHMVGSSGIGALIGEHALGPFFSSVLPSLIKPLLGKPASAEGLKGAVDLGLAVARGENLLNRAAVALFRPDAKMPASALASDQNHDKLKKRVDDLQANPAKILEMNSASSHYLPDHAVAMGETAGRVTQYLSGLKPKTDKMGVLGNARVPSKSETSRYDRALTIAEKPITVLHSIKEGTLTFQDVKDLRSMYPGLYLRMSQKLTNELIDHTSKGKEIPYRIKLPMSAFLGQPLDDTMTPGAIQSAQMASVAPPQNPGGQAPQGMKSKHSTTSLSKAPAMYATSGQSRELDQLNERS